MVNFFDYAENSEISSPFLKLEVITIFFVTFTHFDKGICLLRIEL